MHWLRDRRVLGSLLITLCLLAMMVYTAGADRSPGRLEHAWLEVVAPLSQWLSDTAERTGGYLQFLVQYPEIVEENRRLKEQDRLLAALQSEFTALQSETEELRQLLGLVQHLEMAVVPATVISRSPDNWIREVTLNRGSLQGIHADDVVVTPDGLVGLVVGTTANTSRVMLITSPDSGLGVTVSDTLDEGVAEGQLLYRGRLRVTLFNPEAEIQVSDVVMTSELGERYPAGIPVGRIQQVVSDSGGLLRAAWMVPLANMNRLRHVLVIQVSGEDVRVRWSDIVSMGDGYIEDQNEDVGQ